MIEGLDYKTIVRTKEDLADLVSTGVIIGALERSVGEGVIAKDLYKERVLMLTDGGWADKLLEQGLVSPMKLAALTYAIVLQEFVRNEVIPQSALNEFILNSGLDTARSRMSKSFARRQGITEEERAQAIQDGLRAVNTLVFGEAKE